MPEVAPGCRMDGDGSPSGRLLDHDNLARAQTMCDVQWYGVAAPALPPVEAGAESDSTRRSGLQASIPSLALLNRSCEACRR